MYYAGMDSTCVCVDVQNVNGIEHVANGLHEVEHEQGFHKHLWAAFIASAILCDKMYLTKRNEIKPILDLWWQGLFLWST